MLLSVSKELETSCVAIDFGTTNSLVGFYDSKSNKIELVNFDGRYMLPSISHHGDLSIKSIKRAISCKNEVDSFGFETKIQDGLTYFLINGVWVSIVELASDTFRRMRLKTNQQFKRNIINCIITVPARYDEYQKQIIAQAATMAGWRIVRMIAEPTAGFIGQEETEDGVYGVYDLGGGTFDFSLVRKAGEVFQVLGTTGDTSIGVDYIDRALLQKTIQDDNSEEPDLETIRTMREKGQIKDLSVYDEMIERTLQKCQELIDSITAKPKKIYMIGGGSLNEYIVDKVRSLGIEIIVANQAQYSVVNGAALYASWLTNENMYLLIDVAPLSLGVESMHGMVEWIIHRNSPLPVAKKITFTNVSQDQTHIVFNVVQGEGTFAKDCRSLGRFKVEIPKQVAHTVQVELMFILDTSGLLTIKCTDLDTKATTHKISLDSSNGLSQDMIKRIISDSQENAKASEESRRFYKYCEEIDLVLRNFPEEKELHAKRSAVTDIDNAYELLAEIQEKLGPKLDKELESAAQSIFDSLIK